MRNTENRDDWDFTPVISLIHSFQYAAPNVNIQKSPERATQLSEDEANHSNSQDGANDLTSQLGNFESIWKFLGRPVEAPNGQAVIKEVRWRKKLDKADLADNDEIDNSNHLLGLTKSQRKKARRKEKDRALVDSHPDQVKAVPGSIEAESEEDCKEPRTVDRKAVIYNLLDRPLPSRDEAMVGVHVLSRPKPTMSEKPPHVNTSNYLYNSLRENGYADNIARKLRLVSMLKYRFVDERPYLANFDPLRPFDSNNLCNSEGIHIFIDASNIMIGFHDALKYSWSLPLATRIRRQPLAFHSLSLLLARGRPTAKRVVVGSDKFPEMAEARLIGYETNILERVHKAKELTPRQKKYAPGIGSQSAGSGSETTAAAQFAPEKWVEQAVDEILHLKMMESIVDATKPATMVLATGDAAEAEYSGGFLKMVERALGKGWKIELACWRQNMSGAYKRKEFRHRWSDRFKVIELDDFVEVILGG